MNRICSHFGHLPSLRGLLEEKTFPQLGQVAIRQIFVIISSSSYIIFLDDSVSLVPTVIYCVCLSFNILGIKLSSFYYMACLNQRFRENNKCFYEFIKKLRKD